MWAFLPWSVVGAIALIKSIIGVLKKRMAISQNHDAFISFTIAIIVAVISGSKFKLPHYLNITFPFFAILAASFIEKSTAKWQIRIRAVQYFTIALLIILTAALNLYSFPIFGAVEIFVSALLAMLLILMVISNRNFVLLTLIATALMYFNFNFNFYPRLLNTQAGNVLATYVHEMKIPIDKICYLEDQELSNSFDFYVGHIIPELSSQTLAKSKEKRVVYTGSNGLEELKRFNIPYAILKSAVNAKISKINKKVLHPSTREQMPRTHHLVAVY